MSGIGQVSVNIVHVSDRFEKTGIGQLSALHCLAHALAIRPQMESRHGNEVVFSESVITMDCGSVQTCVDTKHADKRHLN